MTDKEVINYNGKNYTRYPNSKRRHLREYYWHHGNWKKTPVSLHAQIWIDNYGDIPSGYIIHHKDGNPRNNALSNLECITGKEHVAKHYADKEWARKMHEALSKGALNRELRECTCKNCGCIFKTRHVTSAQFCSNNCGQQWRKKNGYPTKTYEKVCKKCHQEFRTSKWHRQVCYECYKERNDTVYPGKR